MSQRDISSDAVADRNLASSLAGTSLAILTFLLIFLYPRAVSGEINQFYFQATVAIIVAGLFSFSFSALYNYILTFTASRGHPSALLHRRTAASFFTIGLLLLVLEPTFIFFTLSLWALTIMSLAFWIAYLCILLIEVRKHQISIYSEISSSKS